MPAVAAEPATAIEPAAVMDPATATLPPTAADPATAALSCTAIEPTIESLSPATAAFQGSAIEVIMAVRPSKVKAAPACRPRTRLSG
nr:hypothetical protein [Mycobacterium vicinigordonae]